MTRTSTGKTMTDVLAEDAKAFVKSDLSPERWEHTLGVIQLGQRLASVYDLDDAALRTAALFHDNARDLPEDEQHELAARYRDGLDEIEQNIPGLWHAPAGAQRMIETFDYSQSEPILRAVAYHTTARPNPSQCLMALFVADFSEPNRSHPEADTIRSRIGERSLEQLVEAVLEQKLHRTLETDGQIHPRSIEYWNQLCD